MGTVVLVCEADTEITHASSQSKQNDTFESIPAPKEAKMADLSCSYKMMQGEKRGLNPPPLSLLSHLIRRFKELEYIPLYSIASQICSIVCVTVGIDF